MELPQNVICCQNANEALAQEIKIYQSTVFVLTDENTRQHCLPQLPCLENAVVIEIKSGEQHKNIATMQNIWTQMASSGGDRKSLFINLGGGVIGDMGGLAASLFKRGIDFINVPTTLLSQVDASCGGKLAVDFNNLKNEIGLFRNPNKVIVSTQFLKTLPENQLVSGMAEMIKHALILVPEHFNEIKEFNPQKPDWQLLSNLVETSIKIKNYFTEKDPTEKNIRKMLNFGHTIGHAIESYSFDTPNPLLHGEAVAAGMICELFLSNKYLNFPALKMLDITGYINTLFKPFQFKPTIYENLYNLMTHDKKNSGGNINFSLLRDLGDFEINCVCDKQEVFQALSFYNQINN